MRSVPAWRPSLPIVLRRRLPLVGALGLVAIMVGGSFGVAIGALIPGNAPTTTAPFGTTAAAVTGTPMTGAELQKAPTVTASSTPLETQSNADVLGVEPATAPVQFTVGFALRNSNELSNLISAQETPGSPWYQHWLTGAQEEAMFGPSPTLVQNTINYYTSLGFTLSSSGPMSLAFTGTAAAADTAFHTSLSLEAGNATLSGGPVNTVPLSLPAPLAGSIATINGFEGESPFAPTLEVSPFAVASGIVSPTGQMLPPSNSTWEPEPVGSVETARTNETEAYNYTNHAFYWFNFYSSFYKQQEFTQVITPASLATMYDIQPLLNEGYNGNDTANGSSQITIAIVMAGGINPGDLEGYSKLVWNNPNALIDRVSPIPVDRSYGLNGTLTYTDSGSNEMALDIEYSGTMAPGAKIEPVYGPCLCTNVLDDDYAAIDRLGTVPNIISNSWGGEEQNIYEGGTVAGPNWENDLTMANYFELLTARGSTILASSADGGGFDTSDGILSGAFPATDPYVLSVNGIRTVAANATGQQYPNPSTFGLANMSASDWDIIGVYDSEYPVHVNTASELLSNSYWYEPYTNQTLYRAAPVASGGFGTSYWFNQSFLQHGLTVANVGRALGSGVAAEADFNESIYFDGQFEIFYGGTSFACPTTAGMLADIENYLEVHNKVSYLGNGNDPVFRLGNAWENGNLTLDPYFDVTNGTSYWGNHGVQEGWQWPAGQLFPTAPSGATDYGNTTPGWNFPTGWGVINAYNFAVDLSQITGLPGSFTTTTAGGVENGGAWDNLATNQTYYFQVDASSAIVGDNPDVTVEYFPLQATTEVASTPIDLHPSLTASGSDLSFTLNTGSGPITTPGLLIFTLGDSSSKSLGFEYDWISWALPTVGQLSVQVVQPDSSTITGGSATFGLGLGFVDPPLFADPGGPVGENLLVVRVTFNGVGVYDARVTGSVASPYSLAWEGSRALNASQSYGDANTPISQNVSETFTNLTGYAYVYTWNVIQPTTLFINASYSTETANTTETMVPPPNIGLVDNYDGEFSSFNWVAWILYATHSSATYQKVTPRDENLWAPNSVNQSGWYSVLFGWAGEELNVRVNTYQNQTVAGDPVWFGNYDLGRVTKFYNYEPSFGVVGYTNDTASSSVTGGDGIATIQIPQNESNTSQSPIWGGPIETADGLAAVGVIAASVPGESNDTVSIPEPCPPEVGTSLSVLQTCVFNDSVRRNYTSTPILVLPDPVLAWTQTPAGFHRNFFGSGSNISFGLNVSLPNNNPFVSGTGWNWPSSQQHITGVTAYVDGVYAGQANPPPGNQLQVYDAVGNLTGTYAPGIHELELVVNSSSGQVFTYSHRFIVGNIILSNFNITHTYTVVPYTINWNLTLPISEISNKTFSQSVEVQYVSNGCSGTTNPCPIVVNLSRKVVDYQAAYNQSINTTMLNLDNFYSGAGFLPSGQYLITIWLDANRSGNVTTQVPTYLVFSDLNGSFDGPTEHQLVPLGNVTISYTYTGGYLENATLDVFAAGPATAPVYTTGIFVPAVGSNPRAGAASWDATIAGAYRLVMELGTPYTNVSISEWINVTQFANVVWINTTTPVSALNGLSSAQVGVILAVAAGVLGFLVGLFVAPAFRGAPQAGSAKPTRKAWEEMGGESAVPIIECPVCHEHFETAYAMHNHQKLNHGVEE